MSNVKVKIAPLVNSTATKVASQEIWSLKAPISVWVERLFSSVYSCPATDEDDEEGFMQVLPFFRDEICCLTAFFLLRVDVRFFGIYCIWKGEVI